MDGVLDFEELNDFNLITEGKPMNRRAYEWMIRTFDSTPWGLTADGWVDFFMYIYMANGKDEVRRRKR